MNKTRYIAFLTFLLIFAFQSCNTKKKSIDTSGNITPKVQKNIIVYGSESCDHCIEFRKKLDKEGLKYTFKDVEANERLFEEMMTKIRTVNYHGYIGFPVIDVEGKIFVRPDFRRFKSEAGL